MVVLGVTTTLSMWAHFAGSFFFGKIAKGYFSPKYAWLFVMTCAFLLESYQLVYAPHPTIWWDSTIDMVMNGMGAFIAVRWVHE